mgnify:CR=1 FL=1
MKILPTHATIQIHKPHDLNCQTWCVLLFCQTKRASHAILMWPLTRNPMLIFNSLMLRKTEVNKDFVLARLLSLEQ